MRISQTTKYKLKKISNAKDLLSNVRVDTRILLNWVKDAGCKTLFTLLSRRLSSDIPLKSSSPSPSLPLNTVVTIQFYLKFMSTFLMSLLALHSVNCLSLLAMGHKTGIASDPFD